MKYFILWTLAFGAMLNVNLTAPIKHDTIVHERLNKELTFEQAVKRTI